MWFANRTIPLVLGTLSTRRATRVESNRSCPGKRCRGISVHCSSLNLLTITARSVPAGPRLAHAHPAGDLRQQGQETHHRSGGSSRQALEEGARAAMPADAVEKGVHGVAGQAAERDCAHIGEDLGHLGVAVVRAQVRDRFRIEPVEMLRVVLGKQDRRGLGRALCLKRLDLMAEDLVDLLERHAVSHRPVGVTPLAVAAVGHRGHAEHDLLAQRGGGLRPHQRCEKDGARGHDVGHRPETVAGGERPLRPPRRLRPRACAILGALQVCCCHCRRVLRGVEVHQLIPWDAPSLMMIFSGSTSYTQGAEFFQPFFILFP